MVLAYFIVGWFICFRIKVFAYLDFIWSSSFLLVMGILFYQYPLALESLQTKFIFLMYTIWSLRLSSHLFFRIRKQGEDNRYITLKKEWKMMYGIKFLGLFLVEAILTFILSIPLYLSLETEFSFVSYLGIALFIIALSAEIISDSQLKRFVATNKGKVCNVGLWKYSRHPNYFFETLIWLSFGIYGLSTDWWSAIGLIPYLIMLYLITNITGVPPAESSSLASKGDIYREYQRQTSRFILWFPKAVVIFLLIIGGSMDMSYAQERTQGSLSQQDRIKYAFTNLRADNLEILDGFYDPKTLFVDPLGEHKGIEEVKKYYYNLYKNVEDINFEYRDIISNGNSHVLIWKMNLKAPGLNSGELVTLEGNSVIRFNEAGLVSYHRDYFDMGEFVYENVAVLGSIIKYVKKRMKGE